MPATGRTRYRLEPFDTRGRLQLPMERLDPLIEIAVLDQVKGGRVVAASDVFATTRRFPFVTKDGAVRSAIPELKPGFVLRDDGNIFSRRTLPPDEDDDRGERLYHFQAGVAVGAGHGRAALETAARLVREGSVEALYLGPRLRPQLELSVRDACGPSFVKMPADPRHDGRGVVIGVVDYGCDFAHRNFRHADGRTRIGWLWDQNGEGGIPEADYGREFDAAAIDRALAAPHPYVALGYDPHANYYRAGKVEAAHGTHVLDIAAGNGLGTGCAGMAPAADIVFVQLRRYDWDGDPDLNRTAAVLDAVAYVFARAGDRPAVVNLSLGTNGGSHDGTSVVERTMDIFLKVPRRAIVVAAGNAGSAALHAAGRIEPGERRSLGWRFPAHDDGPNQLEVWADGPLGIALTDPAGVHLGEVEPGATGALFRAGGEVPKGPGGDQGNGALDDRGGYAGAVIGSRHIDDDLEVLTTVVRPSGRAETWTVDLIAPPDRAVRFDAWIDRDDPGQSVFAPADADPASTLASLACGRGTIVVGAHYAGTVGRDVAHFSARGKTRDGRQNPHLTAPGGNVFAAVSKGDRPSKRGRLPQPAPRTGLSGTSMAAPHVTGAVALLLQAQPQATAATLRRVLAESAAPPPSAAWDIGHGHGWLDVAAALDRIGNAP
ncbi:MAG: S8 family serine peptidase [Alphaproteobacteria bacterium]